ncbi:MAG: hypothetical protein ABR958_01990 [Dehalococcoidales bacterium]
MMNTKCSILFRPEAVVGIDVGAGEDDEGGACGEHAGSDRPIDINIRTTAIKTEFDLFIIIWPAV